MAVTAFRRNAQNDRHVSVFTLARKERERYQKKVQDRTELYRSASIELKTKKIVVLVDDGSPEFAHKLKAFQAVVKNSNGRLAETVEYASENPNSVIGDKYIFGINRSA